MSLLDFDDGKPGLPVHRVYFHPDFVNWTARLIRHNPLALPAIQAEIDGHFSTAAAHPTQQLLTVSWIPGEDWTGTVWQPIYLSNLPRYGSWTVSAHAYAHDTAAKFLGLLFMDGAINRHDRWGSGHYLKDGIPIKGRTYFRI
jgi:hypothetical protein